MSAPQPPERDPAREQTEPGGAGETERHDTAGSPQPAPGNAPGTYEFHGEQLDFDPYRFGAPEPATRPWTPSTAGPERPGAVPAPGERWSPGGDGPPAVRPGDYWQGGAAGSGAGGGPGPVPGGPVFPPAGYDPPRPPSPPRPTEPDWSPPPTWPPAGQSAPGVDLHKPADPGSSPAGTAPAGRPEQPGSPEHFGYPPPGSSPYGSPPAPGSGYPPPTGQPWGSPAAGGNGIAVAGFVVALVALVGFLLNWIAMLVGLVGLGLSIAGRVKASRGGAHKTLATWGIVIAAVAIVAAGAVLVYALSQFDFDCLRGLNGDAANAEQCIR